MSIRNAPKNINVESRSRKIDSEAKLVSYIKTQLGSPLITVDVTEEQILNCIDDAFLKFTDWAYDAQQSQVFVIETDPEIQDYILDDRVKAIYDISIADTTSGYANHASSGISLGGFGSIPVNYIPYVDPMGNVSSLAQGGDGNGLDSSASGVAGGVAGPHTGQSTGDGIETAWAVMANAQTMQNMFGKNVSYDYNSQNHILRIFEKISGPIAIEAALEYQPNPEYDNVYGHNWIKSYSLNLVKRTWGTNLGKYSSSLVGGSEINYDRIISEAETQLEILDEQLIERYSEALGVFSG
jgi:hypothetical protein